MEIVRICPMCRSINTIVIDDSLEPAIERYIRGEGYIQDIPLPATQREFIKTGYCIDCQKMLFGTGEED